MLLDPLQCVRVLLLQDCLRLQVLFAVVFIVVFLEVTVYWSFSHPIDVAKVNNLVLDCTTLLTIHGCGTSTAPFGTLCN